MAGVRMRKGHLVLQGAGVGALLAPTSVQRFPRSWGAGAVPPAFEQVIRSVPHPSLEIQGLPV